MIPAGRSTGGKDPETVIAEATTPVRRKTQTTPVAER
jgi:hypothetical protein